jgi:glutathione S-transferase
MKLFGTNLYVNHVRVGEVQVARDKFSAADITAVVTVDFATKTMDFPLPERHRSLERWYDVVSNRPSAAA